jgi:cyclin A
LEIVQQYSALSPDVLELYSLYNYIHKKMRKKETRQHAKHLERGFRSHGDPMYQQHRSATVDWLCQVGEVCMLGNLTIHTAIGFMDMFLDIIPIDGSRLQLVAAASLLIAAKIEEQEHNIPRVSTLHAYCGATPTPPSFIPKVESLMLNHLNWEMVVVTPLHFLDYYMLVCLSPSELLANPHLSNFEDTRGYLAKMAEFLVDLCEHHSLYREYLPSIVAAAAIGTARQMLKITPVWSQALQLITSHTLADISQCMANIWGHYRQSFAPLS